ncbi:stress responsive protein [Pacificitalea manganoxidans]|uniref:Stress responsive protein n=1 Tax=Pacificitalea manganoxidans TaxID=1411902 RepID=A0A291LXB6_9RHOB|nr:Dabb family protein [Pacificitalea manganoxidans]ATI41349.1 stress responsive protein [Pacificitalea manganoxidans]MAQ44671.1 stress responsive protein [Actibacterium sp.]MBF53126.1 stress responsive protein [Actibacterium sp.]MDR6308753.1 quinol monooxygenase YgiN [Pacificitalea manganoxidans]|tara:strand:+ start:1833 stop:2132 length:300 start_codon:yes stop_codon:yes gene_type:complete
MIRHIVFFSVKPGEDPETVHDGLSLLTRNPHCLRLEIGRNQKTDAIAGGEGPDFVVYGEFEDEAQLAAYKAHPLYQQAIDVVRPLRDMRIAADFVSPTA